MKRSKFNDPYQAVIQRFNESGVRYVVVGMSGINYYARKASELFSTLDYDIFVDSTIKNVEQALMVLKSLGFTAGTAGGLLKAGELKDIVRRKRTLIATTPEGITVELLLAVSGFPFLEMERDAAVFTVEGTPVKVGRLTKLIQSKKLAGRNKDRAFLKRYQSLLRE